MSGAYCMQKWQASASLTGFAQFQKSGIRGFISCEVHDIRFLKAVLKENLFLSDKISLSTPVRPVRIES